MRGNGFTLVEILIVVILLGILAAVVIPQLTSAAEDAKQSAAERSRQLVQKQINLYIAEHGGAAPDEDESGSADTDNFTARLTGRTDPSGKLAAAGACGPYLASWPVNPLAPPANASEVQFGTATNGNGKTGWYFNTDTHHFKLNDAINFEAVQGAAAVLEPGG